VVLSARPLGLGGFTPRELARTSMFPARKRLSLAFPVRPQCSAP
jgi:hypothetical protein